MVSKPLRTKRKSASAERCLRSLGATITMANPIIKTSKCSSEGRIVALMFTKSQRGGHSGYWGFPLSGNCWLIKTLFQTGARVSEFVNIKTEDVFFEEQMILIAKAKGGKSRYVPILPELAQELRTHLGQRTVGYLFETNRTTYYSPRRIQYIVKETAAQAQITKRVYPHLLPHSVATTLLERGMPIEQIQKFLGHSKLETTQVYAESSTAMMRESYQRALSR